MSQSMSDTLVESGSIQVRRADVEADWREIRRLRELIYVQAEQRIGAVDDFAGSFDLYNHQSQWFVAMVNERVVGTVKVIRDSERGLPYELVIGRQSRAPGDVVVEVGHLLALPGSGSRPIVLELLREAVTYSCNEVGATHLVGDVFVDKTRGDAFYRRVGFKPLYGPYRDHRFAARPMSLIVILRMADVASLIDQAEGSRRELLRFLTLGCNDPEIRRAADGPPRKKGSKCDETPAEETLRSTD